MPLKLRIDDRGKNRLFRGSRPGKTCKVLELVGEHAAEAGISTIILASTRGDAARKAMEILKWNRLIIVGTDRQRFSVDVMETAQEKYSQ